MPQLMRQMQARQKRVYRLSMRKLSIYSVILSKGEFLLKIVIPKLLWKQGCNQVLQMKLSIPSKSLRGLIKLLVQNKNLLLKQILNYTNMPILWQYKNYLIDNKMSRVNGFQPPLSSKQIFLIAWLFINQAFTVYVLISSFNNQLLNPGS